MGARARDRHKMAAAPPVGDVAECLVNLTPHDIDIYDAAGATLLRTFKASGVVARLRQMARVLKRHADVEIGMTQLDANEAVDLPPACIGTMYIVSMPVAVALYDERSDLVAPDMSAGQAVRDAHGAIVGTRRLTRYRFSYARPNYLLDARQAACRRHP